MDIYSGRIHQIGAEEAIEMIKNPYKAVEKRLVPITPDQENELRPLSKRKRKFLLKRGSCFCGSGKSFKKCCYSKYKRT